MAKPKTPPTGAGRTPLTNPTGSQTPNASGPKTNQGTGNTESNNNKDDTSLEEGEEREATHHGGDSARVEEEDFKDSGEPLTLQQLADTIRVVTGTERLTKKVKELLEAIVERLDDRARVEEKERDKMMKEMRGGMEDVAGRMERVEGRMEQLMEEIRSSNKREEEKSGSNP